MGNTLIESTLSEEREGFKITDLSTANWAFRKLRAIAAKENEINEIANDEINRINTWKEKELDQYSKDKDYLKFLLEEYYQRERAIDNKFKLSTPYGKVSSRKSSKWEYDEEILKDYMKTNNLPFIRTKEELDKAGIKKCFKNGIDETTGEIIPGIKIEEVETITVKVE